mmetsp:Transcript_84618/g.244585  ORF Transcript_84618/g.244585 Transcript_84618/m.244585 type:complete len:346 (+) Transcript_84618:639-1676(+)
MEPERAVATGGGFALPLLGDRGRRAAFVVEHQRRRQRRGHRFRRGSHGGRCAGRRERRRRLWGFRVPILRQQMQDHRLAAGPRAFGLAVGPIRIRPGRPLRLGLGRGGAGLEERLERRQRRGRFRRRLALVHVQCPDRPVGLAQFFGVGAHELRARQLRREPRALSLEGDVAQVAAQVYVEDEAHAVEVARVALVRRQSEVRVRLPPRVGVGTLFAEVDGLVAPAPEPSADVAHLGVPLGGVSAASAVVEAGAHGVVRPALGAPLVAPLAGSMNVAIVRMLLRVDGRHPATREMLAFFDGPLAALGPRRMQSCHDVLALVHTFDDVELAPLRPQVLGVLPVHPEG